MALDLDLDLDSSRWTTSAAFSSGAEQAGCTAPLSLWEAPSMDKSATAAVLVRVQGPDPKGTKRNDQSFSLFDAGITTLSASGTIVPVGERLVVVTSASVLRPFLTKKNKCAAWLWHRARRVASARVAPRPSLPRSCG